MSLFLSTINLMCRKFKWKVQNGVWKISFQTSEKSESGIGDFGICVRHEGHVLSLHKCEVIIKSQVWLSEACRNLKRRKKYKDPKRK